jgi:hypothetical protein
VVPTTPSAGIHSTKTSGSSGAPIVECLLLDRIGCAAEVREEAEAGVVAAAVEAVLVGDVRRERRPCDARRAAVHAGRDGAKVIEIEARRNVHARVGGETEVERLHRGHERDRSAARGVGAIGPARQLACATAIERRAVCGDVGRRIGKPRVSRARVAADVELVEAEDARARRRRDGAHSDDSDGERRAHRAQNDPRTPAPDAVK